MADDTLEDQAASDAGKVKRAPPTIELEATEVSGETRAAAEARAESHATAAAQPEVAPAAAAPAAPRSISPWVIAPFSGAVAAALVILVGWMLGWPAVQGPPPAPQVDAATVDDLGKRLASLEGKVNKLDQVAAAMPGSFQKPIKELSDDVANLHAQVDKLAVAGNEMKAAPQGEAAASIDLSPLNDRIARIEEAMRASTAQGAKAAESKPQDDLPLRRLVAAELLDVAVSHGDPYAPALATVKSMAPNPDALKPLDQFADKGVPAPAALNRELLTLVPKLSPSAQDAGATGTGIIDKLQAGASKLVRVERTDATGNDRSAIVARVTAAAIRNDFGEARKELSTLSAADRAPAQAWLDKAAARDAALAASRQFVDEAMAALAKQAQ